VAADAVVVVHLLFIGFVVFGSLLTWRWPNVASVHVPVAVYGALVEFIGFTCPLTPLENYLRHRAGETGYRRGFIEHYLVRVIYPPGLTRTMQAGLGVLVLLIMVGGYWGGLHRRKLGRPRGPASARAGSAARPARARAAGRPVHDRRAPTRPSG
jgi:Protein of Unknown function (DUF2784)